jgi:hypothetical protein
MEKLSIEDFENDFQKLLDIKNDVRGINADLSILVNFKSFAYLEDGNGVLRPHKYKDFPNDEIKTIIENFFLKKKNELLNFYKDSISEFKEKYKDIGLDISDRLEKLKLDD